MISLLQAIGKIFSWISTHSEPRFILELALIAFVLKVPFLILTDLILNLVGLGHLVDLANEIQTPKKDITDLISGVLIAPPMETIFGQWLPIVLASRFVKSQKGLITISASFFALSHYPAVAFFPGAFVVGLILAWSWLLKRKEGKWKAFWVTTSIHALHNLFVALLVFVVPEEFA